MPFVNGLQVTGDGRGLVSEAAVGMLFEASLQASLVPELSGGSPTPTYTRASPATVMGYEGYGVTPVDEQFAYTNGDLSTRPGNPWTVRKTGTPELIVASQRLSNNVAGPAGRAFYWPTAWVANKPQYAEMMIAALGASSADNIGVGVNLQGATGAATSGYFIYTPSAPGGAIIGGFILGGVVNRLLITNTTADVGDRVGIAYDPNSPFIAKLFKNDVYIGQYNFEADAPGMAQGGNPGIVGSTASGQTGFLEWVKVQPNLPGEGPDQLKLITCDADEARFMGARRIAANNWSANFSNGLPITPENGGDESVCDDAGPFGYLAEGTNTNLMLQSADFAAAPPWNAPNGCTITPNAGTAPDGTNTAWLFEVTALPGSNTFVSQQTINSQSCTLSCYAKAGSSYIFSLVMSGQETEDTTHFDLSNGTIAYLGQKYARGSITPVGNGWYRCSVTFLNVSGGTTQYVGRFQSAQVGESFYIWGAQFEAARSPSSYIATTAAAATREADRLSYVAAGNIDNAKGSMRVDNVPLQSNYVETTRIVAGSGGGGNRGILRAADNSGYYLNDSAESFDTSTPGGVVGSVNTVKAAWSDTTRKVQLGEGAISQGTFSGDLGFPLNLNIGNPTVQGSPGAIRIVKIAGEDLSVRSATATPLAIDPSDTYLSGRRYATADAALRVLDDDGGAVGDTFIAGWRYNEAGELYVFVTDSVAPSSFRRINGLLTTTGGALCINKTKPVVGHVHGWPVADDGSLCVTTTASLISAFDDAFSDAFG